MIEYCIVIGSN